MQDLIKALIEKAVHSGPSILLALVTLVIGFKISSSIGKLVFKIMEANKMDATIRSFASSMVSIGIKIFVIISAAATLGIETTSFAAALGGAFLAIGVALQGTIGHIASGFMILIFRPFKVGDTIVAQGFTGKVREIQLFSTILTTADNQTVIIPNGALSSGTTQNVTFQDKRRVDLSFTVNGMGFDESKQRFLDILKANPLILQEGTDVVVTAITGGSVTFALRAWTATSNYDAVQAYILENVKKAAEKGTLAI